MAALTAAEALAAGFTHEDYAAAHEKHAAAPEPDATATQAAESGATGDEAGSREGAGMASKAAATAHFG